MQQDKCSLIRNYRSVANLTDRHVNVSKENNNEDLIIILDCPNLYTPLTYTPPSDTLKQHFQDSLTLMHSQLNLYIDKYLMLPWVYKPLSSNYCFNIGISFGWIRLFTFLVLFI